MPSPKKKPLLALAALLSGAVVLLTMDKKNASAPASAPGLPRGLRNNNPGNLRKSSTPWAGKVSGVDKDFETFDTRANGTRALVKNLIAYRGKGFNTIEKIISRWAPPSENNTKAYIAAVASALRVTSTAVLPNTAAVYADLAWQIARHENGGDKMVQHYPYASFYPDALRAFNT